MDEWKPQVHPSTARNASQQGSHHAWIVGRIETLLAHYFSPGLSPEVQEEALTDWAKMLGTFSQASIEHACDAYLRDQPRARPTPGNIRQRCVAYTETRHGLSSDDPKLQLSVDELQLLETKVLPTARRWVAESPSLAVQGARTMAHWGERVSLQKAKSLRLDDRVMLPAELTENPPAFKAWLSEITNQQHLEAAE